MIAAGGVSVGKAARIHSAAESLERLEFQEQLYRRITATPKAELHLHLEATCQSRTPGEPTAETWQEYRRRSAKTEKVAA